MNSPSRAPVLALALLGASFLAPSPAPAAPTVAAVVASRAEGLDLEASYTVDDSGTGPLDVSLYYSIDGDACFHPVAPSALSGDAGPGVVPTTRNGIPTSLPGPRVVRWNGALTTLGATAYGHSIRLKVAAAASAVTTSASFESEASTATEGLRTVQLPVRLTIPRGGALRYQLVPGLTNAVRGTDFEMPDSVPVTGVTASIPIQLMDDAVLTGTRTVVIELLPDADSGTSVGATYRHSLVIYDNDSYWDGILTTAGGPVTMRMKLTKQGTAYGGSLIVSKQPEDVAKAGGMGTFPPNPVGDGSWPLTVTATPYKLEIQTPPIPMGGTPLFAGGGFSRTVTLTADATANGTFSPDDDAPVYAGFAIDSLVGTGGTNAFVPTSAPGFFYLIRKLPVGVPLSIPVSATLPSSILRASAAREARR